MRITQTCDEKEAKPKLLAKDVPVGFIFKLIGSTATYTKLVDNRNGGTIIVNLSINGTAITLADSIVDIVYPNARVVLE